MRYNHSIVDPVRSKWILFGFLIFVCIFACIFLLLFSSSGTSVIPNSDVPKGTTNLSLDLADIAKSSNVLVTLAPSSVPGEEKFVEYCLDRKRFEALPIWELGDPVTNVFAISIDKIIDIARDDVISRYNAKPDKMFLNNVDLRRFEFQTGSRWFYSVTFMVNTSSKPFLVNPRDNKVMLSIVMLDGSVVAPAYTDLSESFEIHFPSSSVGPTPPPIVF